MTRAKINLLLDALMTLMMAAIAGIGFLMNWVLIPGEERPAVYGGQPDLYWLGWDRHQWGDIHLALGIALAALVVLHVVLHWGQVVGIWRQMVASTAVRLAVPLLLLALVIALMAFSAFVGPEVVEGGKGEGRGAVERGMRNAEEETDAGAPGGQEERGRGGEGQGGRGWRSGRNSPER